MCGNFLLTSQTPSVWPGNTQNLSGASPYVKFPSMMPHCVHRDYASIARKKVSRFRSRSRKKFFPFNWASFERVHKPPESQRPQTRASTPTSPAR